MIKAFDLADKLDKEQVRTVKLDILHSDAASELRRLYAENQTLRDALENIAHTTAGPDCNDAARAALGEVK